MPATMFQMGFRAGGFQPLPIRMGISFNDIKDDWKNLVSQAKGVRDAVKSPTTTPLPPPVPVPPSTILGLPSSTVMIGGAALLGVGVLAAVLLSQNKA